MKAYLELVKNIKEFTKKIRSPHLRTKKAPNWRIPMKFGYFLTKKRQFGVFSSKNRQFDTFLKTRNPTRVPGFFKNKT